MTSGSSGQWQVQVENAGGSRQNQGIYGYLGVGFKYLLFSTLQRENEPILTSIFSDGVGSINHQPGRYAHGEKELNQRYESQEPLAWDPLGLNEGLSSSIHAARERPSTLYPLMEKLIATRPKIQKPSTIPRTLQLQAPLNEDEALETFNTFNTLRDLSYLSPRSCGGIPLGVPGIPGVLPDFRDLSRREKVHFRALDRYLSSVKAPMAPSDPCKASR